MSRDAFRVPPVTPALTAAIIAARADIAEAESTRTDARDIVKMLTVKHGAVMSWPTYRVALRCCDIYTEAATSCYLHTCKLLLCSFADRAERYLAQPGASPELAL